MHSTDIRAENRVAVTNGLAIVGFVALIALGMWLAVYSARYVPAAVDRLGSAAVYLGSIFTPASPPGLSVIPTASTTIPFGDTGATSTPTTKPADTGTTAPSTPAAPTPGQGSSSVTQISGAQGGALYGLPDLTASVTRVGYLASTTAESFVASSTVPHGSRPAVEFVVKNVGTNVASAWRFSAVIPTQTAYVYQSPAQQPLNPGDSIVYTLGFDQANAGADQTISITVNFDHTVTESDANNNSTSAKVTVLGG